MVLVPYVSYFAASTTPYWMAPSGLFTPAEAQGNHGVTEADRLKTISGCSALEGYVSCNRWDGSSEIRTPYTITTISRCRLDPQRAIENSKTRMLRDIAVASHRRKTFSRYKAALEAEAETNEKLYVLRLERGLKFDR